jgi:glycosyltransferase involved in cell wall biosynthesis
MTARLLVINAASVGSLGGRLVLSQLLRAIAAQPERGWRTEVVVRNSADLPSAPHIAYRSPSGRLRGWAGRAWLELAGLRRMWRGRKVDAFLSLQGANATIRAAHKFVYCHNALGLERPPFGDLLKHPKSAAFSVVYGLAYRFGIGRRATVIVQQEWQRRRFRERFGLDRCIVAHPMEASGTGSSPQPVRTPGRVEMIYPTSAEPHKNVGLLCEAVEILSSERPGAFRLLLTLSGEENDYSRQLGKRFGHLPEIGFAGQLTPAALAAAYARADLLVYPSRVESWGLPLTEAKQHGLGILAADLPYARETVGDYEAVDFFDPQDAHALAARLRDIGDGDRPLSQASWPKPAEPFAPDWGALVDRIFNQAETSD